MSNSENYDDEAYQRHKELVFHEIHTARREMREILRRPGRRMEAEVRMVNVNWTEGEVAAEKDLDDLIAAVRDGLLAGLWWVRMKSHQVKEAEEPPTANQAPTPKPVRPRQRASIGAKKHAA